ncbi:MAG: hypothetical protein KDB61_06995 [Planctomycetes bacterium]|nr:hypothetical protein [Planctomycetota bacterium]
MLNNKQSWARGGMFGSVLALAMGLASALPQAGTTGNPTTQTAAQEALPTYVRTTSKTSARNFQDRQGLEVMELPAGTLLRVHEKSRGKYAFYEVSLGAGVPVWVYGEYLAPTDTDNVLRVTGDYVNQRPRPNTDSSSTPLRTRLMSTDRVEVIQRQDASKPLAQDWVQIWAPARTRVWVEASETAKVTDNGKAAAEFQASMRQLPKAVAKPTVKAEPVAANVEKPAAGPVPVRPEATKSLRYADHLFAQAIADENVTLAQLDHVEQAYHRVLDMAPAGSTVRELTIGQLEKLKVHQGVAKLRMDLALEKERMQERQAAIAEEQQRMDLRNTVTWGRFVARGWIESEEIEGEQHYFVRWDGERKVEIACASGRYDLAMFEGFQVGIMGQTRRAATPMTLEAPATLTLIDAARIEVIAGSGKLQ